MRYATYGNEDSTVFSFVRFAFSVSPMNSIVKEKASSVLSLVSQVSVKQMMSRSFSIETQFANLIRRFRSIRFCTL